MEHLICNVQLGTNNFGFSPCTNFKTYLNYGGPVSQVYYEEILYYVHN